MPIKQSDELSIREASCNDALGIAALYQELTGSSQINVSVTYYSTSK